MAITVADVRDRISTPLDDVVIQRMIDAETEAVNRTAGPVSVTENRVVTVRSPMLVLRYAAASVTSIEEREDPRDSAVLLSSTDWRQFDKFTLVRLSTGTNPRDNWAPIVTVTYNRVVDNALRDRVILDLVQLAISFRAEESVDVDQFQMAQIRFFDRRRALLRQLREPKAAIV